jgi:hypothetical protein
MQVTGGFPVLGTVLRPVIAKETYLNVTVEKLQLLTLLQDHERQRNKEEGEIRTYVDERLTVSGLVATADYRQ